MIWFYANSRCASIVKDEDITTGSVGLEVGFSLSAEWEGLAKTAVFRVGDESVDVYLLEDHCPVPPELLTSPGEVLAVGLYGTDGSGGLVIPTVYADAGSIVQGAAPSGIEPTPQTASLVEQLLAAAQAARNAADEAERLAQSVRDDADNGEFDGEDGADGSGVWYTTERISGGENPFVRRRDLIGREGATVQVHDLLFAPDVGDGGAPTTLYEITSVGIACLLNRLCKMQGEDGASAYEIAVEHGYTGTEEQWLESLHGQDATVDATLSNEGEAADAKATGAGISAAQNKGDYALKFAETMNNGDGIPLDAEWLSGDIGGSRPYRAHSKRAVNTERKVLQAAAGYRFYLRIYSNGSYSDSSWYGPDYSSRLTYTLPEGADYILVVSTSPEDQSVTADPDVYGSQVTIRNNIGSGGGSITVDSALSDSSENPVQNKVIKAALDEKADASDVPTKTSDLQNDSGFLTQHQSLAAYRTAAAQDAIDQQIAGAIPTKTSDLQNDSGFLTQHQDITGKLDVAQGSGNAGKFLVVGSDGNVTAVTMSAWQGGSY